MEKLYGVQELAERWHCTERTARERMRKIGALKKPMLCRESAIEAWERANTEYAREPEVKTRRRKNPAPFPVVQGPLKPGQYISRVRLKKAE